MSEQWVIHKGGMAGLLLWRGRDKAEVIAAMLSATPKTGDSHE